MVLSAILYHANVHLNSRSSATLFHQGETVRQLALSLEDPTEAARDSNIGTVGLLAATGVSIHLNSFNNRIGILTVCGICRISLEMSVKSFFTGVQWRK
jgi:hypothetical protein